MQSSIGVPSVGSEILGGIPGPLNSEKSLDRMLLNDAIIFYHGTKRIIKEDINRVSVSSLSKGPVTSMRFQIVPVLIVYSNVCIFMIVFIFQVYEQELVKPPQYLSSSNVNVSV